MSDYEQQYAYDEYDMQNQMQLEQDYETKVQLEFFEAEQLLRNNQIKQCIDALQQLYKISEQNQLKNWKVKILNLLLQIYCKSNDNQQIQETLNKISELNKKQKYTQNSIKSIIITIKSLSRQFFNLNKHIVYEFINQLDNISKIKSYLLFLQKSIEENQSQQDTEQLFKIIDQLIRDNKQKNGQNVPSANLIELYSFRIKYSKNIGRDISEDIRKIQLKLTMLEAESYLSEGHISVIKSAIAEILFKENDFIHCTLYLNQAFQENVKYGKNIQSKKSELKINLLVCLLTNNEEIYMNQKYCALFNQMAASFKGENDVQSLFGLIEAFKENDLNRFIEQAKMCQFTLSSPYQQLLVKVISKLKSNKILNIIKPYKNIKLSYLCRRAESTLEQVQTIVVDLIADHQIQGRLRRVNNKEKSEQIFLDIKKEQDEFERVQLENIRAMLMKR